MNRQDHDNRPHRGLAQHPLWWAVLLALFLLQTGCVQRRITIRSNPPGALVYIDDTEIGTTPCSTSFIYYGKRKIRLVKDGYETLTVEQRFWPPWYEVFPLEVITENLVPYEFRDERNLMFSLVPQRLTPIDQLLERGENLRQGSRSQIFTVPAAAAVAVPRPSELPLPGQPATAPVTPITSPPPQFMPPAQPPSGP